jgi:hypothetical protein
VLDLLSSWSNSLGRGQVQQIWKQVPLCVMWGIWRGRNARHFEDVEMPVLELCRNVLNICYLYGSRSYPESCYVCIVFNFLLLCFL